MENALEVTGCNLVELVKAAYNLSQPQGMGFLHFEEGTLSDEEAKLLINENDKHTPVSLDYVKGRSCKMTVFREGEKLFILDKWFDHSENQLLELIDKIAI